MTAIRTKSGGWAADLARERVADTFTPARLVEVSLLSGAGRPAHRGTGLSIELAGVNCRRHGLDGFVRARGRGVFRCVQCSMPYEA